MRITRSMFALLTALVATFAVGAADQAVPAKATFAGGCFWCMEPPFDKLDGVAATVSGYSGGRKPNPTYKDVSAGDTGHAEVVQVTYDPAKISYEKLLDIYWRNVDPLDGAGQFCDRGDPYRPAIFYHTEEQKRAAEQSKAAIERTLGKKVIVPIQPAAEFYAAEDYHQDYYQKNPVRYKYYRHRCGRDARLEQVWGKAAH